MISLRTFRQSESVGREDAGGGGRVHSGGAGLAWDRVRMGIRRVRKK